MFNFNNLVSRAFKKIGYTLTKSEENNSDPEDLLRLKKRGDDGSLKLHFGCGPRILKGWCNIDLSFEPFDAYLKYYTDIHYPEKIRGTREDLYVINIIKDGLPLPDNSVDMIFHEDFFEHLTQKQQIVFLAETWRVLKPGAVHRVNTPNLAASMRDNSDFSKGKDGVYTAEWDTWDHFSIVSPPILEAMARIVGYSDISFNSKNSSIIADQLPKEYRPDDNDRKAIDSNVFADLIK